ncbi:hypothetical protein KCP73_06365 [Salmonella enterica subsp. enterica]|nr:hypothetical protein KCP73_06365 [Salmonella enterica subsp. enterica]
MIHGACVSVGCCYERQRHYEIFQFVTAALAFGQPSAGEYLSVPATDANMQRRNTILNTKISGRS